MIHQRIHELESERERERVEKCSSSTWSVYRKRDECNHESAKAESETSCKENIYKRPEDWGNGTRKKLANQTKPMIKQGSLNVNASFVRDPTLIQSSRQVISLDARTFSHRLSEEKGPGNQSSEKLKLKHLTFEIDNYTW